MPSGINRIGLSVIFLSVWFAPINMLHAAPTYSVIYSFGQSPVDGEGARTGLTKGSDGRLFGINENHGTSDGTIFELVPPAPSSKAWTETILYQFPENHRVGSGVNYPLLRDGAGVLYGEALAGGFYQAPSKGGGFGTVFRLVPPAAAGTSWTAQLLHIFHGKEAPQTDGTFPNSPLIRSLDHAIYGVTQLGGVCNLGTAYQLTVPKIQGLGWNENAFSFPCDGSLGSYPSGGLVVDQSGALYGTAQEGGASGYGTVFKLIPPTSPGGSWSATLIYSFQGGADGDSPAGLTFDGDGGLFGATDNEVFHLTPPSLPGGSWTNVVLYTFALQDRIGFQLNGQLYMTSHGDIVGSTKIGGDKTCYFGCGTIFKLLAPATPGSAWKGSFIYRFNETTDGAQPVGNLVRDSTGAFYGVTNYGGVFGRGTVFKFVP